MGFQPSGDTTTQVTLDINLTKLGREKLVYGTGSRVSYFTLHDEGINYTSSLKPTRGYYETSSYRNGRLNNTDRN